MKQLIKSALPTIISEDCVLKGNITCKNEIQIDGHIIGDVHAHHITVSKNGIIEGDIIAEEINLYGLTKGHVRTRKIHLFPQSHIEGHVVHENITIETGAIINGSCLYQNFESEDQPTQSNNILSHNFNKNKKTVA